MSSELETLQEDFHGRALASEAFAQTAVILQRKALTEAEINKQLGTLKGRNGKVGTMLLVRMPELRPVDSNVPGPQLMVVMSLLVIEHPTINANSQGSGQSAEKLALAALRLFHHFHAGGSSQYFNAEGAVPDDSLAGLVAFEVSFSARLGLAPEGKVATPTISQDGDGFASIACATAGAEIAYTIDRSYPGAENAEAEIYASGFAAPAGTLVRACATKAGMQASNIAQLILA